METVSEIIRSKKDKKAAVHTIRETATHLVPSDDQKRFIEKVEISLRSLHEGNIARFKIKPLEYEIWAKTWH